MKKEEIEFVISTEQAGERLDKVVLGANKDWSRARVQEWIQEESILVDGKAKKGSYRVKDGEIIQIMIPPVAEYRLEAENIPLDIRYEDKDILVVNKPRGMVVHPGSGNYSGTLVNALLAHCKEDLSGIGGVSRPGIVHRIDKDTSGLLMVAKNDRAHRSLSDQLKEHSVDREYLAIVHGVVPHETGTINAPLGRDSVRRQQMAIKEDGKDAVTHFSVERWFNNHTLLSCRLETGRTHQIRMHLKYIGFPVVGDPVYGLQKDSYPIVGQALHAKVIGFIHPRTKDHVHLECELPQDMNNVIAQLEEDGK